MQGADRSRARFNDLAGEVIPGLADVSRGPKRQGRRPEMVKVVLPCGFIYHQPPYTDEEVADLYRRMSGIVSFTRPGGQRAAAEETSGDAGSGPEPGPEDPDPGPVPP